VTAYRDHHEKLQDEKARYDRRAMTLRSQPTKKDLQTAHRRLQGALDRLENVPAEALTYSDEIRIAKAIDFLRPVESDLYTELNDR